MSDFFNLSKINKDILKFITTLTSLSAISEEYLITPDENNGEKLVKIFEKAEKNMLQVKLEVATMVDMLEENQTDSSGKEIDNGKE